MRQNARGKNKLIFIPSFTTDFSNSYSLRLTAVMEPFQI